MSLIYKFKSRVDKVLNETLLSSKLMIFYFKLKCILVLKTSLAFIMKILFSLISSNSTYLSFPLRVEGISKIKLLKSLGPPLNSSPYSHPGAILIS